MAEISKRMNDISGEKFNRLLALSFEFSKNKRTYWKFVCDCGNQKTILASAVTSGKTKGCGCALKERRESLKTHNMTSTREYATWRSIRMRCNNESHSDYKNYGGRGIKVCDRWNASFENFFEDMGPRPKDKNSIDRINVNGDYDPKNCRWSNYNEQSNNKRNNRKVFVNGNYINVTEAIKLFSKVSAKTFYRRIKLGASVEEALFKEAPNLTLKVQRLPQKKCSKKS